MKKTIMMIHNGMVLVDTINQKWKQAMPDVEIKNIIDETLVRDIIAYRGVTPQMVRRIARYALSAEDAGACAVVMTCSSLSETVDAFAPLINIPSFKIDEPMAGYAVNNFKKIGLMGTLASVIGPSTRLLESKASEQGKEIQISTKLCEEAFLQLIASNVEKHDEILTKEAIELAKDVDVLVMAQGSMAKIAPSIEKIINKPVLTCIDMGIEGIAKEISKLK